MLCKKTYKNQITIPKKIMDKYEDVEYFKADEVDGKIVLEPVKWTALDDTALEKVRQKICSLGLTEQDIEDAIAWARKK